MPYCTRDDLVTRFGEEEIIRLTDHDNSVGAVVDAVLDQAIADATGEIDGYIAVRHSLPLPQVPAMLVQIACDIARYYLYEDHAHEQVRERYEDARRRLEGIAAGKIHLGLPEPAGSREDSLAEFHSGRHEFKGGGW